MASSATFPALGNSNPRATSRPQRIQASTVRSLTASARFSRPGSMPLRSRRRSGVKVLAAADDAVEEAAAAAGQLAGSVTEGAADAGADSVATAAAPLVQSALEASPGTDAGGDMMATAAVPLVQSALEASTATDAGADASMAAAVQLAGTVQDAMSGVDAAAPAAAASQDAGVLQPIVDALDAVLSFFQSNLEAASIPYSYGFSIILLVLTVKVVTFPFTRTQVESSMQMQILKPRIENIRKRYGKDKDKITQETSRLYQEAGVDPAAGCFPTLISIPIYLGLYRSLSGIANEGLLDTQGFFWIPTLAGPTSIAARQAGSSTSWLFPFVDGAPASGWDYAGPYLVLPVLLVVAQYVSTSILSPPVENNDDDMAAKTTKLIISFLPLFIGWVALNVPSGLQLYYFSNSVLTSALQIWLRKLGGLQVDLELGPVTQLGMGRRMGPDASADAGRMKEALSAAAEAAKAEAKAAEEAAAVSAGNGTPAQPSTSAPVEANGGAAASAEAASTTSDAAADGAASKSEAAATVFRVRRKKLKADAVPSGETTAVPSSA